MPPPEMIAVGLAGLVIGAVAGLVIRVLIDRSGLETASKRATSLEEEGRQRAGQFLKEAEVEAKEEALELREKFEKDSRKTRDELKDQERRLTKQEDSLERRADVVTKKEKYVEGQEKNLSVKMERVKEREVLLDQQLEKQKTELFRLSGLSPDEAKKMLLDRLERTLEHEVAIVVARHEERVKEECDKVAKKLVGTALQRVCVSHTSEVVVSAVDLPNDEMKGRIIGREGRNIRAFERATGVDVIVDDTPGIVVISCFDGVRRFMAVKALQKLIQDGRIHPARIEEVTDSTKGEINDLVQEMGRNAVFEMDIGPVHPKIITLLGRLYFRTSYGQNVLQHSIEVGHLCGVMGAEMGLDPKLAKRCGFLHDIGKAVDHEIEGGHPQIGGDLAKRYDEDPIVVNAIASHHEDIPQETMYATLAQIADAISGSRPGARRESLERYIKRMQKLEAVVNSFAGVRNCYAIQAGREVRVIVNSDRVDDSLSAKICRDIAKEIEQELTYPGEVKVTLLRETRHVDYAR